MKLFKRIFALILFLLFSFLSVNPGKNALLSDENSYKTGKRFIPKDYKISKALKNEISDENISINLFSQKFAHGDFVYAEIIPIISDGEKVLKNIKFYVNGTDQPLTKKNWGYRNFFVIPPEEKLKAYDISLSYFVNNRPVVLRKSINIAKTDFPVYQKALHLGKFSDVTHQQKPEIIAFIEECRKKKNRAFSTLGPDYIGSAAAHPRDLHYITSPFWSKRRYQRFKKENGKTVKLKDSENIHSGLDLKGDKDSPVFALMDGRVVLAEKLYYEGNFVVIDHGNRIFSYYMHMNSIAVKEGDIIKAGQLAGRVGSTGISTGPHLHVSLIVRGVQADPLSVLPLPIRE